MWSTATLNTLLQLKQVELAQRNSTPPMHYRRTIIPGGTLFSTLLTDLRRPILASDEAHEVLRDVFQSVRQSCPFAVDTIVIIRSM